MVSWYGMVIVHDVNQRDGWDDEISCGKKKSSLNFEFHERGGETRARKYEPPDTYQVT